MINSLFKSINCSTLNDTKKINYFISLFSFKILSKNIFLMTYSQNSPRIETDALFSWFIVCCGIVGAMNLAKLARMGKLIDYFNISLSISQFIRRNFLYFDDFHGLITGIFISKYGPRLAMFLGLFISLIGGLAPVFYPVLSVLMIGRIFEGCGFINQFICPSITTLHTNEHNRGRIMGIWEVLCLLAMLLLFY